MKFSVASLALFVAGSLAQFTINTPSNVVECQPTLLTWSGGVAPYYLSVLPGATPNGVALENLGQQNGTSVTWICNIASGQSIGLTLRDSSGSIAQTAPFTVNPGSSTSCTNTTSISAGPTSPTSAAAPSSSAATSGISTPVPATTPATTGTTTTPGSTHTSSVASGTTGASSSTSSSGASANVIRVGAAGIAGVAVAALFF